MHEASIRIPRDIIPQEPIIEGLKANRPKIFHDDHDEMVVLGQTSDGTLHAVEYIEGRGWEYIKRFTYLGYEISRRSRVASSVQMTDSEIYGFRHLLPNCSNYDGLRLAISEDFNGDMP